MITPRPLSPIAELKQLLQPVLQLPDDPLCSVEAYAALKPLHKVLGRLLAEIWSHSRDISVKEREALIRLSKSMMGAGSRGRRSPTRSNRPHLRVIDGGQPPESRP